MIIDNVSYDTSCFHCDDIYIFAFGYEHRSYYLYDQIMLSCPTIHPTVFVFDDYEKYPYTSKKVREAKEKGSKIIFKSYRDFETIQEIISETIKDQISKNDSIIVHIDYSSMPRSWYCKLPILLADIIRETDKVYFWYSEGIYPPSYEEFPSAGIDSFSLFSGKPSLQIDTNRIHVLGLGYDVIRSQGILSILDPNYLVVCYAYNPQRDGFLESLQKVNKSVSSRAALNLALHINDFKFMVSKPSEIATEFLLLGNVILIPDGPKPLIFAISLIPDILCKSGLTCLHISRNSEYFEAVDVTATGTVYGFSIRIS